MANRYWVGGTADWNTTAGTKWALTSGGAGGQAVPTTADDVFFDANSGAVTISVGVSVSYTALCNNFDCTGFTGTLAIQGYSGPSANGNMNVYGSFTLGSGMTIGGGAFGNTLVFKATSTGKTITSAGKTIKVGGSSNSEVQFDGVGGGWTIQDDTAISLFVKNGALDTNGKTITVPAGGSFAFSGTATKSITLGTSTIINQSSSTAIAGIDFSATTGSSMSAASATIKTTYSGNVVVCLKLGGYTYGTIWFDRGASTGASVIGGSNTIGELKNTGTAANKMGFLVGTTQTVTTFTVSGSAAKLVTITTTDTNGNNLTTTHSLTKAGGGTISCDYLSVQHSIAAPANTWYAGVNSTDNQAVATAGSGWIFTAPTAVGPANLKSYNTNVKANIKSINTNPLANIKSLNTNV